MARGGGRGGGGGDFPGGAKRYYSHHKRDGPHHMDYLCHYGRHLHAIRRHDRPAVHQIAFPAHSGADGGHG